MPDILKVDQASEDEQVERLKAFKADRDRRSSTAVSRSCARPRRAGTENLLPRIREALKDRASIGEVCGAMNDVFGEYQPEV